MRIAVIVSLGAVLTMLTSASGRTDPAAGEQAFSANKCGECHITQGPAQEKTIADQLAKKGPELWYAGSKFQQPWLEQWLQDPKPIRPLKYNSLSEENPDDHPKLAAGDAASIMEYLMSLTSADVEAGVIKPKKNPKGRLIFVKKDALQRLSSIPGQEIQGRALRTVLARRRQATESRLDLRLSEENQDIQASPHDADFRRHTQR